MVAREAAEAEEDFQEEERVVEDLSTLAAPPRKPELSLRGLRSSRKLLKRIGKSKQRKLPAPSREKSVPVPLPAGDPAEEEYEMSSLASEEEKSVPAEAEQDEPESAPKGAASDGSEKEFWDKIHEYTAAAV